MKRPRALVFDLDGTLADTRLDIAAACNHALASLGRPTQSSDVIARFVGDGARVLVARALEAAVDAPVTDEALATFNAYYPSHAADHATWMPGAREALGLCDALGIAMGVATNKPRTATLPLLEALGLGTRFEVVVAGGDGPLKPHPAAIQRALAGFKRGPVDAKDAWVVGDGPQDIGAGKAAGTFTVAVLGGFATEEVLRLAGPDHVLASLHGLRALLGD